MLAKRKEWRLKTRNRTTKRQQPHWLQRIALLALGCVAASFSVSLAAQDFPAKPVRMGVP